MTYEKFKNELAMRVRKQFDNIVQVDIVPVTKNNGTILDGMILKEKSCNVAQTIYLNDFYKLFESGMAIEIIVERIVSSYNAYTQREDIDISFFSDYKQVKDKIIYKLVNKKLNEGLLNEVPYVELLDMVMLFYCYLENDSLGGSGTIMIRNEHMKKWNISVDEIFDHAKVNTPKLLGVEVRNINDVLRKMLEDRYDEQLDKMQGQLIPMYVATNKMKNAGAGIICYDNFLKIFSGAVEDDIFIIPCSIHEVIIIPAREEYLMGAESLKELILYVNSNELSATDILSDNLYYYSREDNQLKIV